MRTFYNVGDVIEQVSFLGPRLVRVTKRDLDVKGRPGFDRKLVDPATMEPFPAEPYGVWGYDYQVVRVVKESG